MSLPEQAKQWLDTQWTTRVTRGIGNPDLTDIYEWMSKVRSALDHPEYSVSTFRVSHFQAYPEESVAGLAISDSLFLDLIWRGVYTVQELKQGLENNPDLLVESLASTERSDRIRLLYGALEKWLSNEENPEP